MSTTPTIQNRRLIFILLVLLIAPTFFISCEPDKEDVDVISPKSNTSSNGGDIQGNDHGRIFPPEKTGNTIATMCNNFKIYQHRSPWSPDMRWMIFVSDRDEHQGHNYFAMNMPTLVDDGIADYTIIQLTDHQGIKDSNASTIDIALSRKYENGQPKYVMYYTLEYGPQTANPNSSVVIIELDYGKLIEDALNGTVKPTWHYDRQVRNLSWGSPKVSGGISLDANEDYLYLGVDYGNNDYKIHRVNVANGAANIIHSSSSFKINHIQANPTVPNLLSFNLDRGTGVYAYTPLQHLFVINGDGSGLKWIFPIYTKSLTHTTWLGPNTVGMHLLEDIIHIDFGSGEEIVIWEKGLYTVNINTNSPFFETGYHQSQNNPYIFNHHSYHPGTDTYILDATEPTDIDDYQTQELWKYNATTGQFDYLTGYLGGTHGHQSISEDGRFVLYQERLNGNHELGMIILP